MLLFLAFGSVLLPIKAVLMNLVSIGASFGVVVWVFQEGHLADLLRLHVDRLHRADQPDPRCWPCSSGWPPTTRCSCSPGCARSGTAPATTPPSVAAGLQHTGRIITAAALLLIVVVAGFATGGVTFIKMIGVGMIVAIVVDATLVRALLVPATMRLLGRWNWWAPGPLARSTAGTASARRPRWPVPEPGAGPRTRAGCPDSRLL